MARAWQIARFVCYGLLICCYPTATATAAAAAAAVAVAAIDSHWKTSACAADSFACNDGPCILREKMCDGRRDCADASDELNCDERLCRKPDWFQCAMPAASNERLCLASKLVCNGIMNCPAGEDEKDCKDAPNVSLTAIILKKLLNHSCNEYEFTCAEDNACIPLDFMCDGKTDCKYASDELRGCKQAEFHCAGYFCPTKKCLEAESWLCDGVDDCGDGSDEKNCTRHCTPELNKFRCSDNSSCIALQQLCDGRKDCADGSDEAKLCNPSAGICANYACPATAKCVAMLHSEQPTCICPKGYQYNAQTHNCEDIDECRAAVTHDTCSQSCKNTPGAYECSCDNGYYLASDKRTCLVQLGSIEPLLLYTTQVDVNAVYLRSRRVQPLAQNLKKVIGVTSDGAHIYWTNIAQASESIVRANMNGSEQEVLLNVGLDAPEDLSVDWLTGNIYFTDNVMQHVAVCAQHGQTCIVLIAEHVDLPRSIAVCPQRGQMFWTDWGSTPMIMRASMDGTQVRVLATENVHWPNGIALDMPSEQIYWVDAKHGAMERMRFDGTERSIVLDGILKHPFGIAVFEDKLYWSDWGTKSLHVCNKLTGKDHDVLVRDRIMYDVHIFHPAMQPQSAHACLRAHCSHLCLLAEHDNYSCACPEGMQLASDNAHCMETHKRQQLYIGLGNKLVSIKPTYFGRHDVTSSHQLPLHISEMIYNSVNGSIIVADNLRSIIYEYDPDAQELKTLLLGGFENVTALGFDYLTHNLYIADAGRHTIEVLSLQTRQRAIINYFAGMDVPIGLVVWPEVGALYMAVNSNGKVHIARQTLSGGSAPVRLFEDDIGNGALKFALEPATQTLYWTDSDAGTIAYMDHIDAEPRLFRSKLQQPYALTIVGHEMFWTQLGAHSIYWTHLSNLGNVKRADIEALPDKGYNTLPTHLPLISSVPVRYHDHPCLHDNGHCTHVCVTHTMTTGKCLCAPGYTYRDAMNQSCIETLDCEYRCKSGECLTASRRCNGHRDCSDGSDELDCAKKYNPGCALIEYTCHDGLQCIELGNVCNGRNDCTDGSDEQHCETSVNTRACHAHQYVCGNGKCVDLSVTCDGRNDCGDNSDETQCGNITLGAAYRPKCTAQMFQCDSGTCIPRSWECDTKPDCIDGSDEHEQCRINNCTEMKMHECANAHCIDARLVCDGYDDCGDQSDEWHCAQMQANTSAIGHSCAHKFQCKSKPELCFEYTAKCNGTAECPNGEDESDCAATCSANEFKCADSDKCILGEFRCDKERDCADGSDERNCDYATSGLRVDIAERACRPGMYDCQDGACIPMSLVCNGAPDCKAGIDEGASCASACNNQTADCAQQCWPTPAGAVCACFAGFKLNADKRTCADIDECAETETQAPVCAQRCENTHGSYSCLCYADFMLRQDRTTCKAIEGPAAALLYATSNEIRSVHEQPTMLRVLLATNGTSFIKSFDLDVRRSKLYFITEAEDLLYMAELAHGRITHALAVHAPNALAVDWLTAHVYVLSRAAEHELLCCSFAAERCTRLHTAAPHAALTALVVDAYNRRIFYATQQQQHEIATAAPKTRITIAQMDNSQPAALQHKFTGHIQSMAIDPHKQTLYFVHAQSSTIESVSYASNGDHKSPRTMLHNSYTGRTAGLSIFENHAYFSVADTREFVRCQLYAGNECQPLKLTIAAHAIECVHINSTTRQPLTANHCDNAKCAGICIPNVDGHVCLCDAAAAHCTERQNSALYNGNENAEANSSGAARKSVIRIICVILLIIAIITIAVHCYDKRAATKNMQQQQQQQQKQRNSNLSLHFSNALSRCTLMKNEVSYQKPSIATRRYFAEWPILQCFVGRARTMSGAGTDLLLENAGESPAQSTPPCEAIGTATAMYNFTAAAGQHATPDYNEKYNVL